MKKIISISLIILILFSFSSCDKIIKKFKESTTVPTTTTTTVSENVEFINNEVTINVGDTNTLLVDAPEDAKLKWSSSDTSVVKVFDDGEIEGVSEGTATITVQLKSSTDTCFVTVISDEEERETVTSVTIIYKQTDNSYWLDDTSIKNDLGGYTYLNDFTEWQIQEMINQILAHNQYKFKTDEWFDYFSGYEWYYYNTSDMSLAESRFNSIERENYNYLAKYRNSRF